jgi:formate-dependent nitrite reductase membrane component NrfD
MNPKRSNLAEQARIPEARLDQLREEASRTGKVQDSGILPVGSPVAPPAAAVSYHGQPVLKPPTWTWQIPLYFFVGGLAGTSAVIALVSHISGSNPGLVRAALWVAFAGALLSPPLLIADLGLPSRFLNMLRVFKLRSAMSMGAWTLVAFSSAVGLAVVCRELILAGYAYGFLSFLEWVAEFLGALTGLILASYTSVLLGVTAIPVWSENRKLLPAIFLAGGLGSSAAVLELAGFRLPAMQLLGIAAAAAETVAAIIIEARGRYVDRPLREGAVGWLTRIGSALAGPVSLLLRFFWAQSPTGRQLAAITFLFGALIGRYAWIAAGRESSRDPQALFQLQRHDRTAS